jgi:AraC-like DNA-binding protein
MNLSLTQIISLIAIFQLIVFIIFLLSKKHNRLPNRLLAAFLILQTMICFNFLVKSLFVFHTESAFYFLLVGDPAFWVVSPVLYFYVRSLCYSDFRLQLSDLLHLAPAFVIFLMIALSLLVSDSTSIHEISYIKGIYIKNNPQFFITLIMYIQFFIYNILSLKIISEYRSKLKMFVSSTHRIFLSWLKFVIVGFMAAWIINLGVLLLFFFNVPFNFDPGLISFAAFLIFFNVMFFKGWNQSDLFLGVEERKRNHTTTLSQKESDKFLEVLYKHIEQQRPYLDPELSLKKLSESVSIPVRQLSQLINENSGSNFYDFINSFRIETAKKQLILSEKEKTVSEIFYESGFNTKSSFNTAFKKDTGMTPTEFRINNKFSK